MTLNELIETLIDFKEGRHECTGEEEVVIIHQPNWPFVCEIIDVGFAESDRIVLAMGSNTEYAGREEIEAVGW